MCAHVLMNLSKQVGYKKIREEVLLQAIIQEHECKIPFSCASKIIT